MSRRPATIKRLNELVRAFPELRQAFLEQPAELLREWNLEVDPGEVATIWQDPAWLEHLRGRAQARHQLRSQCIPEHAGLRLWRERQENRCLSQLGQQRWEVVLHYPAAFELSQGCSVGCWFCGFAAPRLSRNWPGSPENIALWRQILGRFGQLIGPAAARAFCYWATDPLDNPDYEGFCQVFQETLGEWPRTTTALATRNPERTRSLLARARQHGSRWDRLSVLSLGELRKIYQHFDPEELLEVELVIQSAEELLRSTAGRARQAVEQGKVQGRQFPQEAELAGTIACVSGFLVNLVEARVQLISPCNASPQFPLGYRVFAQEHFQSADDFGRALEKLTHPDVLEWQPGSERLLRWRLDLHGNGLVLHSPHLLHTLKAECLPAAWPKDHDGDLEIPMHPALSGESPEALAVLCQRLRGQGTTMGEAMLALQVSCDQAPVLTRTRLLSLWQAGLLSDD